MPIYALGDLVPEIHTEAFIHPDCVIIGAVKIGAGTSVWPCAVIRGDTNEISIGDNCSIQDGAIIHCTADLPTIIGNSCTVGHNAHLEGCRVSDFALVGSGALVLHEVSVGESALVAAGAICTRGLVIPPNALAVGVPARIKENAADKATMEYSQTSYARLTVRYSQELRRIG